MDMSLYNLYAIVPGEVASETFAIENRPPVSHTNLHIGPVATLSPERRKRPVYSKDFDRLTISYHRKEE
jgi:hypothetical protein